MRGSSSTAMKRLPARVSAVCTPPPGCREQTTKCDAPVRIIASASSSSVLRLSTSTDPRACCASRETTASHHSAKRPGRPTEKTIMRVDEALELSRGHFYATTLAYVELSMGSADKRSPPGCAV